MSAPLKIDFIDIKASISPKSLIFLQQYDHELQDVFGNSISKKESASLPDTWVDIYLISTPIARLQTTNTFAPLLKAYLEKEIEAVYNFSLERFRLETDDMIGRDLENLLEQSETEDLTLEKQLQHFLKILRTYIWAEKASIFGIYDGYTLEGLAGIGGNNQQNWKMTFSTLAGTAASTRKVYHSENLALDPKFQQKEGETLPRNLVCYPLLHGDTLVGVLNLSNKVGGKFQEEDLNTLERFSRVAAHLLQKHYFKQRMQSFEKTSQHLGKYLSSKVVKNVKTLNQLELGGIEKKVICLFADIRGYTSISEGVNAPTLVKLLNFHFECMTSIIEENQGSLDKIVGDLVMAVWNIPHDQPEPELFSMKAAIEMQKEMIRTVAPEWAKHGVAKVGMGIGVNGGIALAGNLGSSNFMNYTVIGDAINTAQRLEAKAQAGEIWMAEEMYEYVKGKIEKPMRKESAIRLKGKDKAINAYVYRPLSY